MDKQVVLAEKRERRVEVPSRLSAQDTVVVAILCSRAGETASRPPSRLERQDFHRHSR